MDDDGAFSNKMHPWMMLEAYTDNQLAVEYKKIKMCVLLKHEKKDVCINLSC